MDYGLRGSLYGVSLSARGGGGGAGRGEDEKERMLKF